MRVFFPLQRWEHDDQLDQSDITQLIGLVHGVGAIVGKSVGSFVGNIVGRSVGVFVGCSVGRFVGLKVGAIVGEEVVTPVSEEGSGSGPATSVVVTEDGDESSPDEGPHWPPPQKTMTTITAITRKSISSDAKMQRRRVANKVIIVESKVEYERCVVSPEERL